MNIRSAVRIDNVCKQYCLGTVRLEALKDINLEISEGDFVVLAGPSGSGKTTLLNIAGLIDKPTAGRVRLDGEDVTDKSLNSLHRLRRDKIGYIFQSFNLIPVLNVYENVEYPLLLCGTTRAERHKAVTSILERVGLSHRIKHRPDELSGGERQRVSIARAVVKDPWLVLADEPTGNLDSATGIAVVGLMQELNKELGITFLISSHDSMIISRGRRVIRLRDGRIEENGEK
ncbi:MAG: ABC transporter ATP-binding protein [Candidatus Eisenbacteria bacterium]|nr:ABC transporter ATP-binding protein [Candidatus Eisenbacteria bacterium]